MSRSVTCHYSLPSVIFIILFCTCFSLCGGETITFFISDRGINQWDAASTQMDKILNANTQPSGDSYSQMSSSNNYGAITDSDHRTSISIPMPDDNFMSVSADRTLEYYFYSKIKTSVEQSLAEGNYDYDIQLAQNINTWGYFDSVDFLTPSRQEMVARYANAAYGAIRKVGLELRDKHDVNFYASLGSNGTVAFAKASHQLIPCASMFKFLDFMDGRAHESDMQNVIDIFGADKIMISSSRGDYPGASEIMPSIANHETNLRLLKNNPKLTYLLLEPVDKSKRIWGSGAHILRMTDPDAEFRVNRFYVDNQNNVNSYNVKSPLTSRQIAQTWGTQNQDLNELWHNKPVSIVISTGLARSTPPDMLAGRVASLIPSTARITIIGNDSDTASLSQWLSTKVGINNITNISSSTSDAALLKSVKNSRSNIIITFEKNAPNKLPQEYLLAGKDLWYSMKCSVELYAGILETIDNDIKNKDLKLLKTEEARAYKALKAVNTGKDLFEAFEKDYYAYQSGDLSIINSDLTYEFSKMFTSSQFDNVLRVYKINAPADSIKKAASVLSRYKSNKYNWLRISLFEKLLKSA
ncbi:MAG TPA: hypothetical protein PK525_11520 [Anaerohalosphaeraceae bacterium]|nr:hypothetical protein [Anaerohalosphaeraceae bacterium]